jgi:hypothetical protein
MKRFQTLIADAKAGSAPWETLPQDRIPAIARALTAADITDIVAELDALAQEKSATPDWDGDTRDDIARAQQLFAQLITAVPVSLRATVDKELEHASGETRDWVALARGGAG